MASLASRPRSLATVTFMRERAHASNNGGASPVRRRLTYRGRWPPGRPAAPPKHSRLRERKQGNNEAWFRSASDDPELGERKRGAVPRWGRGLEFAEDDDDGRLI